MFFNWASRASYFFAIYSPTFVLSYGRSFYAGDLGMKYFSIYKRDDGDPEYELRQLSNLSVNERDSRLIDKCSRSQVEEWLQLRADSLVPTADGDEITPNSILAGLDLLCSAKFAVRD